MMMLGNLPRSWRMKLTIVVTLPFTKLLERAIMMFVEQSSTAKSMTQTPLITRATLSSSRLLEMVILKHLACSWSSPRIRTLLVDFVKAGHLFMQLLILDTLKYAV